MAEPEVLFEVDAALILAKLHLGGLQPCSYDKNKEFIVNTGIKNDDPNAKPDNPGKVEFDLTNNQGEYEVGFVTTIGPYTIDVGLGSVIELISKLIAEFKNRYGDKTSTDEGKGKPILDKDDLEKSKKEEEDKHYAEVLKQINEIIEKNKESIEAVGIKIDEFISNLIKEINTQRKAKDKSAEEAKKIDDVNDQEFISIIDELIKEIQEKGKQGASSKSSSDKLQLMTQKALDHAVDQLTTYLNVFIGPDQMSKFKKEDIVKINIADEVKDSKDSRLIKNYEIIPMTDVEREKQLKKFQTDPDKCIEKVCFKTGYKISIEK